MISVSYVELILKCNYYPMNSDIFAWVFLDIKRNSIAILQSRYQCCAYLFSQVLRVKQMFWTVKKIPGASFRENTVQSSSNLNRIEFITAFLPRQYKRKWRQYFDKFSQLSLCNCKVDIYEAGSLIAACVFEECSQISGPAPSLANMRAFTLCKRKIKLHRFTYPKKFTAQIANFSVICWKPCGCHCSLPRSDVPVSAALLLCWAAALLCLGKSKKELVCGEMRRISSAKVLLLHSCLNNRFFPSNFGTYILRNWLKNIWVEALFLCYCCL